MPCADCAGKAESFWLDKHPASVATPRREKSDLAWLSWSLLCSEIFSDLAHIHRQAPTSGPIAFSPIGSKNPCYALAPYAPVAQLDRASDYESEGRKFESSRVRNENKGQRELAFLRWGGSA